MDGWMTFLFTVAVLLGGAVVLTLLAALSSLRDAKPSEGSGETGVATTRGDDSGFREGLGRLAAVEGKIGQISRLIDLTERSGGADSGELLERQRLFLRYLVDYADKYSALALRRMYRDELDWILSLMDDATWMERIEAFRERMKMVHDDFASRGYFGTHPILDLAFEDISRDFDDTTRKLLSAQTGRLIEGESPITEAATLRLHAEGRPAIFDADFSDLDRAFDRFVAELELS